MKSLKRLLSLALALCLVLSIVPATALATESETSSAVTKDYTGNKPADGTTKGEPFAQGTGGSNSFRIPAMVTLSNGKLVAAADARWNTTYDGGGLDTIVSVSEDNGESWSYTFANYLGDNGNVYNGSSSTCFIDPALAVTKNDTIYMLCDLYPYGIALNGSGNTAPSTKKGFNDDGYLLLSGDNHSSYGYYLKSGKIYSNDDTAIDGYTVDAYFNLFKDGTYQSNLFFSDSPYKVVRTGFLYLTKSTDEGKTWSEPTLLNLKTTSEMVCLVAPGRGLVTDSGMIVFPVYSYNGSQSSQTMSFLYSEDGVNWKRTANYTGDDWSSESAVVQLNESTLRFFYRNGNACLCYVDYDLSNNSWGSRVKTDIATNSNCQISAITYSKTFEGKQVILVSCPTGPSGKGSVSSSANYRLNGNIFVFAVDDTGAMSQLGYISVTSNEAQFMYSCLTELKDGKIAILYEDKENAWGTGSNCYYTMDFQTYDPSEKLTFDETKEDETPDNGGVTVSGDGFTVESAVEVNQIDGLSAFVAYDVKLNKNGTSYTGSAQITIPLNSTFPTGLKLRGFVVEENGGITYIDNVQRDDEKDTLTFTAHHFSVVGATVAPLANDEEIATLPDAYKDNVNTTTTAGESYWQLVSDGVSGINSGEKYLIAYKSGNSYYLLGKTGGATKVTVSNNKITTAVLDANQFTLTASGNTWTIMDSDGKYLYPTATRDYGWNYSLSIQQSDAKSVTISGSGSGFKICRSVTSSNKSTKAYINASSASFDANGSGSTLYLFKQVTTEGKTVYTVSTIGINALINAVPTEQGVYTNETWSAFQTALTAAKDAVSNTATSYETEDAAKAQLDKITTAAENLYKALLALEKYQTIDITINYTCGGAVVKTEKMTVAENVTSVILPGRVASANGDNYKVNSTTLPISPKTQTTYTVPVTLVEGEEVSIKVGETKELTVTLTDGQYVKWTTEDGHYVSVAGLYDTTNKTYGNTGVIVGNNVTTDPVLVTGTVYNKNGTVSGVYKWLITVTANADTNTNKKYIYINIPRIQNCTVYYSVNAGELIEITDDMLDGPYTDDDGTYYKLKMALVDEVKTGKLQYSFFAAPDEGYALTYMASTNSASQYYVLGNGSNPDGTDSSAWPFVASYDWSGFDELTTKPAGDRTAVWNQTNGYRWGLIEGNFTVAQLRVMFTNAIALGCDGTLVFTKNNAGSTTNDSSDGNNLISELAFVAEKLPEIQKVLTGVTHKGNYTAYTKGMTISIGDTLHYTLYVCVPTMSYTGSQSIDYNNFALVDELTNHQWFASTLNSQTAEEGFAFGAANAKLSDAKDNQKCTSYADLDTFTKNWTTSANEDGSVAYFLNSYFEYYDSKGEKKTYVGSGSYLYAFATSLTVTRENFLDVVTDGKIVNTAELSYYYQGKYSNGSSENASNVEIGVKIEMQEYVIDFGSPVEIDLSEILVGDITSAENGKYGDVKVNGTKIIYTPNKIMAAEDYIAVSVTQDGKTVGYGVRIYPASTIYYEEGFINWGDGWTGGAKGDKEQKAEVLGKHENNYGYDDSYKSNTGASNGTQASTSTLGAQGTFTFTGTGFDLYANCDENTGTVIVRVYNAEGKGVKLYMVDTHTESGDYSATQGQEGKFYSLPIVTLHGLKYGEYTVFVSKVTDDGKTVNIDGVRIYNTLSDSSIYAGDQEQNPTFEEIRDHVLNAIGVTDSDQYGKLDKIVDQVYSEVTGNAIVISNNPYAGENTDEDTKKNTAQDLLDNGPKNELYLHNGESLVFKVTTTGQLQLGLKAPKAATSVKITINSGDAETMSIGTSVDMFYQLANANGTKTAYTVTVENIGEEILSVTQLKICGAGEAQETALQALTENDIRIALLAMGYSMDDGSTTEPVEPTEPEEPEIIYADAIVNIDLVDHTGNSLASVQLTANGVSGEKAVFSAQEILEAVAAQIPEKYALVDASAVVDLEITYGETTECSVQIGKVTTVTVNYVNIFGRKIGTATLTKIQTADGRCKFTAAEIKAGASKRRVLWLTDLYVSYGSDYSITVVTF